MAKQRDTEWITTTEAAVRIGQSAQAIRDGIKAGKYEGHKVKDHVGRRWVWMVDAKTLPPQEGASLAKQSQSLRLSEEQLEGIVKRSKGEALAEVKPALQDMAEQLSECQSMLHKLLEENTVETKELRKKVEAYEEQARKRSWWRSLLGGGGGMM